MISAVDSCLVGCWNVLFDNEGVWNADCEIILFIGTLLFCCWNIGDGKVCNWDIVLFGQCCIMGATLDTLEVPLQFTTLLVLFQAVGVLCQFEETGDGICHCEGFTNPCCGCADCMFDMTIWERLFSIKEAVRSFVEGVGFGVTGSGLSTGSFCKRLTTSCSFNILKCKLWELIKFLNIYKEHTCKQKLINKSCNNPL